MESINAIFDRIGEIRGRGAAPPIPGRFRAMLEQRLAEPLGASHHHGAPEAHAAAAESQRAAGQQVFAPQAQAATFSAMASTTLGAMLGGDAASPVFASAGAGGSARDIVALHGIEGRNGRLSAGELVSVGGGWDGRNARLLAPAAASWEAMRATAASEGVNLYAIDTYRTWESQDRAHEAFLRGEKHANVLPAGHSQHGYGLAIDLTNGSLIGPGDVEWHWMQDNGRRFGWHPISNESWHWEFRGSP